MKSTIVQQTLFFYFHIFYAQMETKDALFIFFTSPLLPPPLSPDELDLEAFYIIFNEKF